MSDVFLRGARMPGQRAPLDVLLADGRVRAIVPSGVIRTPARAEVVELDGRYLIPGLWDNHVHFTQWALASQRLDVSAATSAAEVAARVAGRLASTGGQGGQDSVFVAHGFRDGLWPDVPSRDTLDRASGDRPVVIVSGDLHACWLNSAALVRFGYDDHVTGLLREDDCFAIVTTLADLPTAESDALAADAQAAAARRGVVGIVDFEMADNAADWVRRIADGQRLLRVAFGIYATHLDDAVESGYRTGDVIPQTHGLLTVGPFKVITDGSLNTRTAFCFDVYPGLEHDPHGHGLLTVQPDALHELLGRAVAAGLTPALHAIGDHANSVVLDAFETLGVPGRVEHAQLLADNDFARFAELGVVASVQPEHALDDRDVADHYWTGRTGRAFALNRLLSSGAQLLLGSDAPVAPLDPWISIAAAVSRTRDDLPPWHAEQGITVQQALAASTNGQVGIGVGMPADLAVLDLDPYVIDASALRAMPVAATYLAGRATHLTL